jgi:putative transposase
MDERYLMATVRYVELNPVRAGLCRKPWDWPWSSAPAHLAGEDDLLVAVEPMLSRVDDWSSYLDVPSNPEMVEAIRKQTRTCRPKGSPRFLDQLESVTGQSV